MAIKTLRLGPHEDIIQWDDADYTKAIETDAPIKAAAAVDNDDAVILSQIPTPGNVVASSSNITDNAIVRGDGGAKSVQESRVTISDSGSIAMDGTGAIDIDLGMGAVTNYARIRFLIGGTPRGQILYDPYSGVPSLDILKFFVGNASTEVAVVRGDGKLFIEGNLNMPSDPPASASDTGTAGDIAWDSDYIYICTATDTWKRVAISTW